MLGLPSLVGFLFKDQVSKDCLLTVHNNTNEFDAEGRL